MIYKQKKKYLIPNQNIYGNSRADIKNMVHGVVRECLPMEKKKKKIGISKLKTLA